MNAPLDYGSPAPVVSTFSGSGDKDHAVYFVSFVDPERAATRESTIDASVDRGGYIIIPAESQTYLPDGEPYLSQAFRVAQAVVRATAPHLAQPGDWDE